MNYTYSLEKLKDMGGNLVVKEFSNEKLELETWHFVTWHFVDLLVVSHHTAPRDDDQSFQRCKRWLFENHPEIMI
jgi:hypothetical protein